MRNREADRVRKDLYAQQDDERKMLATVRSAFGLTQYEDKVVQTQPVAHPGGYSVTYTQSGYRVDGLRLLRADLLAAADATRASDALARLKEGTKK